MIVGVVFLSAPMVQANELSLEMCFGPFSHTAPSVEVTTGWPLVVNNAFSDDGTGHAGLNVSLLIPVQKHQGGMCLGEYLVENLRQSPAGVFSGQIVPTSKDNPVFFYDEIVVDPALITDWSYTPTGATLRFGMFGWRQPMGQDAQDLAELGIAPRALPTDWE